MKYIKTIHELLNTHIHSNNINMHKISDDIYIYVYFPLNIKKTPIVFEFKKNINDIWEIAFGKYGEYDTEELSKKTNDNISFEILSAANDILNNFFSTIGINVTKIYFTYSTQETKRCELYLRVLKKYNFEVERKDENPDVNYIGILLRKS